MDRTKVIEIPQSLVDEVMNMVPLVDESLDFSDWTITYDPTLVESQALAKAFLNKEKRDQERTLAEHVAAFRVAFLYMYRKGIVNDRMSPETAKIAFLRAGGKKRLKMERESLREEDIEVLTGEWYELYSQIYLDGRKPS